ncbi:MAG: hypothetical protein HYZ28_27930 [Myxococcales bacterium]|nr:hypothetical protein [Myxococcales bacterium]
MAERSSLQSGMWVRGPRDELVGRVVACGNEHLLIRRAWRQRRAALCYDELADLSGGVVHLERGREALLPPELARGPMMTVRPVDPTKRFLPAAARYG